MTIQSQRTTAVSSESEVTELSVSGSWQHSSYVPLYNPNGFDLKFQLDPSFEVEHPAHLAASENELDAPAVGVHGLIHPPVARWEPGQTGVLEWHPVPFSSWLSTRAEFGLLSYQERRDLIRTSPLVPLRYSTHLGLTTSLLTSDGQVVLSRRDNRYAERDYYDSYVRGTLMVQDMGDSEMKRSSEAMRLLLSRLNISMQRDIEMYTSQTHLAVRYQDCGVWIGGWARLTLSSAQFLSIAEPNTITVPLEQLGSVALTSWCELDTWAMLNHSTNQAILPIPWDL